MPQQTAPDPLMEVLRTACAQVGLSVVAVTTASSVPDHALYLAWLAAGFAGELSYLHRDALARQDVRSLLPEAKSVVTVALSYHHPFDDALHPGHGKVARYARGRDYHLVLKARLQALVDRLTTDLAGSGEPLLSRVCVDTAPLLERSVAAAAGLGFIGKNTLLITPGVGSYTVLGELLLSTELPTSQPLSPRCGDCRLCLDACPTGALTEPFQLDARRCISYLTIENSGEIPQPLRAKLADWIFGCDLCQSVCPYNVRAQPGDAELLPKPALCSPELAQLLTIGAAQYRQLVKRTALRRINRTSLLRNVAVALGNVGTPAQLPVLGTALLREPELVRQHLAWAVAELALRHRECVSLATQLLGQALAVETEESVEQALRVALGRLSQADEVQAAAP
ncbi:MAG: tRNA epoxyqueuosine(34) reductase QueG [Polyangia bacterium]|jgi:epoxyqueuosine reductase